MATAPEAAKNTVGFIPDRPYLYEKLTGMEFLKFTADLYGVEETRFPQKAAAVLEQFSLSHWSGELIESYSHGMKQRLVFASALLHRPRVLIVDEPMVGLDPRSMRLVKDILREQTQQGSTVFMSTHTLAVAEEIADRIGVITNGRLLFLGTVAELQAKMSSDESLEKLFLALTEEEVGDGAGQW